MADLRGSTYVWSSGDHVHLWVKDGDDGWRDSGWAVDASSRASGVAVDREALDELVMMRFAELVQAGRAIESAERALSAHQGNGGCVALAETWATLRPAIAALPAPP
jgi:hypothetical protein